MKNINILIIGGTGFIGRTLSSAFSAHGYNVVVLSREFSRASSMSENIPVIRGDILNPGQWQEIISDYDVLINLAGASVFRRWTPQAKREIMDSRIVTTRNIVDALRIRSGKVKSFLSVSGVGYYGFHQDEILDENDRRGTDFLANVAAQWEKEALRASEYGVRVLICRFGHVLGLGGGVLPKLISLAKLHLASRWGSGVQWISWVHEADVARALLYLLHNETVSNPVNITAPKPVQNREMMKLLAQLTRKRVLVPPIPEFILRLITGEFATVFMNGQRVVPEKLLASGYCFEYSKMENALHNLLFSS
jgi:uncharacterized protein (TIGR01777 family)